MHAVHVGTKMQAFAYAINKMQLSDGNSTRQVVDKIIRSPNRQTCKGHCH